jgi:DNA-directed RNA polymerase specialized sigma subunit
MTAAQGLYSQDRDPITRLSRRQRDVLRLMTEENKSQLEVSVELGITRQRVRQIVVTLINHGYVIPGVRQPKN